IDSLHGFGRLIRAAVRLLPLTPPGRRTGRSGRPDAGAAALEQDDVAPDATVLTEALPPSDLPESAAAVQRQARDVFREDAGLEGPDPLGLRGRDEHFQE